ncbi:peptidogalycan biosysnthesis protein [Fusobacterium necrophorum subsp. funduliforme]
MYFVKVKDNIEKVEKIFFNLNIPSISSLFRTKEWLRDSQWRLGDKEIYLELFYQGKPLALFPMIIYTKISDYPPIDPHKFIENALKTKIENQSVAYCATLFGLGSPILVKEKNIDWDSVMYTIKLTLKKEFNCNYLVLGYCSTYDTPFSNYKFNKLTPTIFEYKRNGILKIEDFSSFEDYKKSLKKKYRENIKKEIRNFQNNGLVIKNTEIKDCNIEELGKLSSNVFLKYGSSVEPEKLSKFLDYIGNTFPKNSRVLSCMKDGKILTFLMYIMYDGVVYSHTYGKNYELDQYGSYFIISFHELIKYSIDRKYKYIIYGSGSEKAKEGKGVIMQNTYGYVF